MVKRARQAMTKDDVRSRVVIVNVKDANGPVGRHCDFGKSGMPRSICDSGTGPRRAHVSRTRHKDLPKAGRVSVAVSRIDITAGRIDGDPCVTAAGSADFSLGSIAPTTGEPRNRSCRMYRHSGSAQAVSGPTAII